MACNLLHHSDRKDTEDDRAMLATVDPFEPLGGEHGPAPSAPVGNQRSLQWQSRYDGLVAIATIDGKAVAGISGPWSGKYALTWWERPMPARELELHDTLGSAQREVEEWALRMHMDGYVLPLPVAPARTAARTRKRGLFDRLFARLASQSASEKIERLRSARLGNEPELGDLHFAANE